MKDDADLMQHLTHMTSLAEWLPEINEEISSKKFATVVFGSFQRWRVAGGSILQSYAQYDQPMTFILRV